MARRITFYFPDENILSITSNNDALPVGTWMEPYPSTTGGTTIYDLLKSYGLASAGQSPEPPVLTLMAHYGEPVQVVIEERNPETGDGSRVLSDFEVKVLSNPEALALIRENPKEQVARSVPRPERKRMPWEREGFISEP